MSARGKSFLVVAVTLLGACKTGPPTPLEPPPKWAYPGSPTSAVTDAAASAPNATLAPAPPDLFAVPDMHPESHGPMPEIVAHGRKPVVQACGFCHLATGDGRPENAGLAGLPYGYIVETLADMRSGRRHSSVPDRAPTAMMDALAKIVTDEEIAVAAKYFAALTPHTMVQVVETDAAPRSMEAHWILAKDPAGGTEPLGTRIVEVPEDLAQFERRDDRTRYVAYVPKGSIARGQALVTTGGPGKTTPCLSCHGTELRGGTGIIPPLAGRSPSYVVRQLYDFKSGARAGWSSSQMKAVVGNLSEEDMISIAAYVASRPARP